MVIITDERQHAEKMIEEGFLLSRKLSYELSILYKYFKSFGVEDKENQQKLHDFCKFWLRSEYNYVKFIKIIDKVSKNSKKSLLKQEKSIKFTESEMKMLYGIEDMKHRKVLFILMFFGKVDGFDYCNSKETEIFKLAHVLTKPEKRTEILRWLFLNGYTKPTMTGGEKILCIDHSKDSVVAFEISKYENPIVYLHAYDGDKKVKQCEGCGVLFLAKSNSAKWCDKCREKKRLESWRESKRRISDLQDYEKSVDGGVEGKGNG